MLPSTPTFLSLLNLGMPGPTTDGAALLSSTTLTSIGAAPDYTLLPNSLLVGSLVRVRAFGRFSTSATPTLLLGVYYGGAAGVALCATAAVTTLSGAANNTWFFEADINVRTVGSSGTAMSVGKVTGVSTATGVNLAPATAPAVATIDTTAAKSIVLCAQWGTNSASNTITCHHLAIDTVGA